MLRDIYKTNESLINITPRNCTISTMTVIAMLDSGVCVQTIADALTTLDDDFGLALAAESPKKRKVGGDSKTKSFCNQVEILCGTTSVKVFSNGRVHATGIKSPVHFADIVMRVMSGIEAIFGTAPQVKSITVPMINAIFCAARELPLRLLRDALVETKTVKYASYDPDHYPGINAKIAVSSQTSEITSEITTMLFTTGNVIISGAKSPEHISDVYATVCHVIDALNPQTAASPVASCVVPSTIEAYNIVDGYSSRIRNLCLGA
jgi:TATA-box binding protein (TBP) (component of TFIID and TFIIIB)